MVSVFICTYNPNYDFLKRTVDGILKQNLEKNNWEFVIIDNNSKSPVSEIDFIKDSGIKVLIEKKQGLTAARGCALKHANGNLLVFVDDDNILDPNYLTFAKELFKNPSIGIVSGEIIPEYSTQPEAWFKEYEGLIAIRRIIGDDLQLNDSIVFNDKFPIGAGMVIRKELIQDYYENHLSDRNYIEGRKGKELSSGEDLDLDFFAISKGFKIGVSPRLKSIHLIPEFRTNIQYISKLIVSASYSSFLVNKKWSKYFGKNVFDYIDKNIFVIILRVIIHFILGFTPRHYIKYLFFKQLLKNKLSNFN